MKTTLSALVTLAVLAASLGGLAACDRKPSPTPPKPTTTAIDSAPPAPATAGTPAPR